MHPARALEANENSSRFGMHGKSPTCRGKAARSLSTRAVIGRKPKERDMHCSLGPIGTRIARLLAIGLIGATGGVYAHDNDHNRIEIRLKSYNEVPAVSSVAMGTFKAHYDGKGAISYDLSYSGLEGDVRQAHIHFGQHSVNGAIMVWLCQTAANVDPSGLSPVCPPSGTVSGVVQAANVSPLPLPPAAQVGSANAQGIAPGEFDEFVKAIRAGAAYVNVHSSKFPGGELRGQLRGHLGDHDRD